MPRPNKPRGHLLLRKLAESDSFAVLSPKAAVLFLMLIPHFDNYGKMHADSNLIKGLVCPKVHYLTVEAIERALIQISEVTSIKYFRQNGTWYLQALNFEEHQSIRKDRRGADTLPNYTVDTSY